MIDALWFQEEGLKQAAGLVRKLHFSQPIPPQLDFQAGMSLDPSLCFQIDAEGLGKGDKGYLDHLCRRGYICIAPEHFVSNFREPHGALPHKIMRRISIQIMDCCYRHLVLNNVSQPDLTKRPTFMPSTQSGPASANLPGSIPSRWTYC